MLLDELGAGTDPVEGAALAVAIIEQLRAPGRHGWSPPPTTPSSRCTPCNTDGVENACCEFDVATLRPTYRLLIGVPGRSNAFAISERLGLPSGVIENARTHLSGENARFEDVVAQLEGTRQELEKERRAGGEPAGRGAAAPPPRRTNCAVPPSGSGSASSSAPACRRAASSSR